MQPKYVINAYLLVTSKALVALMAQKATYKTNDYLDCGIFKSLHNFIVFINQTF